MSIVITFGVIHLETNIACTFSDSEVRLADVVVGEEVGALPLEDDPAVLEDVGAVGDGEGLEDVLLDEENGDARLVDLADDAEDLARRGGETGRATARPASGAAAST